MDLVQPAWYTGKLIVGESTAQGQCLFSSVAMLVFGRRDDYVAVWLRGLCQLELMAYWEQYLDWFGNETASDMQKTLVGNDGNDWPVAEVLWVLANLLQRRIVVVRKLNQRTSAAAGGDKPFVVLPVRHAVNGWVGEAPLVLLHDNDHYQPLHASWSDGPLRQLAFGAEAPSSVLRDALQPLVGEWCNEPLAIVPLD